MARSIDNTKYIDFVIETPNARSCSRNYIKFHRFCDEILPKIHHNVVEFRLDYFSMERILLACKYPNLSMIVLEDLLSLLNICDLAGKEYSLIIMIK